MSNTNDTKQEEKRPFETEMEKITNDLIDQAIGSSGRMTALFNEHLKELEKQDTIGMAQAKEFIFRLISEAIALRKLLNSRLSKSIDAGSLFDEYFDRITGVDQATICTYMDYKDMKMAERELAEASRIYKLVCERTGHGFVSDSADEVPKEEDPWPLFNAEDKGSDSQNGAPLGGN